MSTLAGVQEALKELSDGQELIVRLGKTVGYDIQVRDIKTPSKGSKGGVSKARQVKDLETGVLYKSLTACGYANLDLVKENIKPGQENWAWYALKKKYPDRFIEVEVQV